MIGSDLKDNFSRKIVKREGRGNAKKQGKDIKGQNKGGRERKKGREWFWRKHGKKGEKYHNWWVFHCSINFFRGYKYSLKFRND